MHKNLHSNPQVSQYKTDTNTVMLGTAAPIPADPGLNLDDKG